MAALLGKMDAFDPQHENWPQYIERLDQFFEANDLTGDAKATKRLALSPEPGDEATKWRATFLMIIGPGPYKLLRSLISHTCIHKQKNDYTNKKNMQYQVSLAIASYQVGSHLSTGFQERFG